MPGRKKARNTQIAGAILLIGSAVQLAAAGMADPQVYTSPDPLVKLQAIARRKRGWALQAVFFPVAFTVVTMGFGMLARLLRGPARGLAIASAALSGLSTVLWLPITRGRLTVGAEVDEMIRTYQPGAPADISGGGGWAFWPYTGAALTSVVAAGAALALGGIRRRTGAIVFLLSTITPTVVIPRWRDWPPFATYLFISIAGLGLILTGQHPGGRKL